MGIGYWVLGNGYWAMGIGYWAMGIGHWALVLSFVVGVASPPGEVLGMGGLWLMENF
jgi:hypothetical protein